MPWQIPTELVSALRDDRVLIIVGCGVSRAVSGGREALWSDLLRSGLEQIKEIHRGKLPSDWRDYWEERLRSESIEAYLDAAEEIVKKLNGPSEGEYRRWLRETVGSLRPKDPEIIRSLLQLGSRISTTNYDSLLELVAGSAPVTWTDGARIVGILRGEQMGIIHWHGWWNDPPSVVLTRSQYEQVARRYDTENALHAARTLLTLLFVGFGAGLDDPHFKSLWEWARRSRGAEHEARHYVLVREQDAVRWPPDRMLDDRLFPVVYGAAYEDLPAFLGRLKPRVHRTVSPVVSDAEGTVSTELLFEWGAVRSSKLVKGYRPGWHQQWNGGHYDNGRDFLWLEYEVHEFSGREALVKIQVESPREDGDKGLNDQKAELVRRILASDCWSHVPDPNVHIERGLRVADHHIRQHKSTTVLRAIVSGLAKHRDWRLGVHESIERVDGYLGGELDRIWKGVYED